jgi:hypothetical protein
MSLRFLNISLRVDQIAVIILSVFIILHKKLVMKSSVILNKEAIMLFLFFCVSSLSSIINSPDKVFSLVQTFNLVTNALAYFVIINTLDSVDILTEYLVFAFNTVLIISVLSTAIFLFSYATGVQLFGINLTQNQNEAFGVFFTMREPNVFGSFMMLYFLLAFILYVDHKNATFYFKKSYLKLILFLVGISILLSFTRGVWLSVLLSIFIYYIFSVKKFKENIIKLTLAPLFVLAFFFVINNVLKIEILSYKLDNFVTAKGGTSEGRLWIWFKALDNWITQKNYLIGNGTFSFASFFNKSGYSSTTNAWIGNMPLTILHDAGILGTLFFFSFYFLLLYYSISILKKIENNNRLLSQSKSVLIPLNWGFVIGVIGIFIAFFFTVALNYTYPWIFMGLLTASRNLMHFHKI